MNARIELERERRFVVDEDRFESAVADGLEPFGGWIAHLDVRRPTVYVDTVDDYLAHRNSTLSVVLHAGLEEHGHKLVLKTPTRDPRVRRERTVRISAAPGDEWTSRLDTRALGDLSVDAPELGEADLLIKAVVAQHRRKRTLWMKEKPLYLSYDRCTYLHPDTMEPLGQGLFLEIETGGEDQHALLEDADLDAVVSYLEDRYEIRETSTTKRAEAARHLGFTRWDTEPLERAVGRAARTPENTESPKHRAEAEHLARLTRILGSGATGDQDHQGADSTEPDVARRHRNLLTHDVTDTTRAFLTTVNAAADLAFFNGSLSNPDEDVRRIAFTAHYVGLKEHAETARSFIRASLERGVDRDAMGDGSDGYRVQAVIPTLLSAMTGLLPEFHRHHDLRAPRLRGRPYALQDVQSELQDNPLRISFHDARLIVVAAGMRLGTEIGVAIATYLDSGAVDAFPRAGKSETSFAVCSSIGTWPFVSVNFRNDVNSVIALAHEVGHAIHAQMAVSFVGSRPVVRESIAALFEIAALDHLAASGRIGPFHVQEWWRARFFRPAYQTMFELELRTDQQLREAPASAWSDRYRRLLEETYGPAVEIPHQAGYEWVKGTHLHRPFSLLAYPLSVLIACQFRDWSSRNPDRSRELLSSSTLTDFVDVTGAFPLGTIPSTMSPMTGPGAVPATRSRTQGRADLAPDGALR